MSIENSLMDRIRAITTSSSLTVVPVGAVNDVHRGIFRIPKLGRLQDVVRLTFAASVFSAAMLIPHTAHANGVGYDANVYGTSKGQVMQQGSAVRMTVLGVRSVNIEVAAPEKRNNSTLDYAVMGAAGGVGAILGRNMGGNSASGKQIGTILGGLAGAVGGKMATDAMNKQEAKQIPGTEITLLNPVNNNVSVVTQVGDQQFQEGDRVLVATVGGNTRVVLDRSQVVQQDISKTGQQNVGQTLDRSFTGKDSLVSSILHTASMMGIQVDRSKVTNLLTNGEPDGTYVGKIVGVDHDNGLVYQSTGRGAGVVHDLNSLSRIPSVGEDITIRARDGQAMVAGLSMDREQNKGR